jgi:hypothetical protein
VRDGEGGAFPSRPYSLFWTWMFRCFSNLMKNCWMWKISEFILPQVFGQISKFPLLPPSGRPSLLSLILTCLPTCAPKKMLPLISWSRNCETMKLCIQTQEGANLRVGTGAPAGRVPGWSCSLYIAQTPSLHKKKDRKKVGDFQKKIPCLCWEKSTFRN